MEKLSLTRPFATILVAVFTAVIVSNGQLFSSATSNPAVAVAKNTVRRHDMRTSVSSNARFAATQTGCCGEEGTDKPHLLAGSYYTLNGFSARLLLNNKGPSPIDVQPTLFSLAGARFNVSTITVGANGHRYVDLQDWTTIAGAEFREGSIQVFHRGKDLVLGTQIYLTDNVHSLSFDEKLTELGGGSRRLEGVWWLPSPQGTVKLAVSNTTDATVCAVIKAQGERPRKSAESTVELGPHETKLLDVESEVLSREHGAMSQFGSIAVEHGGTPGAILARAMASETEKGYSLPIQFSNPAAAKSQNLQGTGLRIAPAGGESLSAKVVVHNASQIQQTLTGSVPFTASSGDGITQLPTLELSSGDTRVIDISGVLRSQGVPLDQIKSAGLELQHTGELGSLITSAFSVGESGNQVFRMPIWDVAAQRSATGGYPWYIDGDSSTIVYVKNTTDQPRQFRLYLMYERAGYLYPLTTVAAHQTNTIDIRALRDNHIPDENGNTIPTSIAEGQIEWSMTGGEDRVMIGRSEQVDLSKRISSNYACMNCCGNSFYDAWINPDYAWGFEGEQVQFIAMQQDANCYEQTFPPYVRGAIFSEFIPSICQPDGFGSTALNGVGQTTIRGGWQADAWLSMGGPDHGCEYNPVDVLRDALCEVLRGPDHVRVINDQQGVVCQGTLQVRQIEVQVVDINNVDVTRYMSVGETFQNQSTNTCGNGNALPAPCAPVDPGGRFTDGMSVGGTNPCRTDIPRNSGCGYTLTSTWRWCTFDRPIWQYNGETRSNIIEVNNTFQYPPGTYLYAPGVPTP